MVTETRNCNKHGETLFLLEKSGYWRCLKCRSEHVTKCRQRRKKQIVDLAGGKCIICGYARCSQALEFHHKDPLQKDFAISDKGFTRSKKVILKEIAKCVLVCANCHREIEAGIIPCP